MTEALVAHRFHIEDLVVQDASGVVYQALDTEAGVFVDLRRFFPFGPDGAGLDETQQDAYRASWEQVAQIEHPSVRTQICCGFDPIDHMPYLVSQWVDGTPLPLLVEKSPLSSAAVVELIDKAMEISERFSLALSADGIWVETDLQTIIVGDRSSGKSAIFSAAPVKNWIGANAHNLQAIVDLTENLMDWRGKPVSDHAGKGLGAWLKWLRLSSKTATLREAREKLAVSLGMSTLVPVASASGPPSVLISRPAVATQRPATIKKSWKAPLLMASALLLSIAGVGGWALVRRNAAATSAAGSEETLSTASIIEDLDRKQADREKVVPAGNPDEILTPADRDRLVALKNTYVTLEGVLASISYSRSRKTMYLLLSKSDSTTEPRGGIVVKDAPADLSEAQLASLVGRKLRLQGRVQMEPTGRAVIMIQSRSAIQTVE